MKDDQDALITNKEYGRGPENVCCCSELCGASHGAPKWMRWKPLLKMIGAGLLMLLFFIDLDQIPVELGDMIPEILFQLRTRVVFP